MITLPEGFLTEAIDNDNRSYQYEILITLADSTQLTITNEDLVESGGVVIDEAVSNDDSLDIGSCVIQKCSVTLRNFNGEFDDYDFRSAVVVLRIGLPVNGALAYFRRGTYVIVDLPVYSPSTITLTCYDYMTALDTLVSSVNIPSTATPIALMIPAICQACGVQRVFQSLPLDSVSVTVPNNDTLTCRELMSYIAQMNGMNCRFDPDGKLYFTWFGSGYSGYTIRQLQDGSVRTVQGGDIRITYPLANEVIWENKVPINGLYTLDIERYDTVVTGVRLVLNTADSENIIDATTYTSGTDDYMISIEDNPLITTANADSVLAALASSLIGFKYRKASFSHVGMPWLMAGDSALIHDAKGHGHNVLVSSTVFTSLDRQTTVSAGESVAVASPSRFSPATKRYAQQMQNIQPVISDINNRIATANGLYETTEVDTGTVATTYYLHNKPSRLDSDIQIMFSDVGILVTANGTAQQPTWYGLTTDGEMLANLLTVKDNQNNILFQVSAANKKMTLADNGESYGNATFKILRTANNEDRYAEMFSDALMLHDGYYSLGALDAMIYPGRFVFTEQNSSASGMPSVYDYAEYMLRFYGGELQLTRTWVDTENNYEPYTKVIFKINPDAETIEFMESSLPLQSTPVFTAANGVTVSDQTWTKIGNMVVGDLTISGVAVGTTTVTLGQLNVHPGHSVIGNARTSSVVARCSIDSSGNIKINSGTSIASTATIYLTFSFVAS